MTTIRAFINRHPVLDLLRPDVRHLVGRLPPWSVLAASRAPLERSRRCFPFVVLAMLAGPSVAGILLTGLVDGRAGLREMLSRLLRWRVGARWYAMALLTRPALGDGGTLRALAKSPRYSPRTTRLAFCCSVSWRGLRRSSRNWAGRGSPCPAAEARHGVLAHRAHRGRAVGSVALPAESLGKRHLLRSASPGPLRAPVLLAAVAQLPAYRVLMVWVYDRTWEPARGDAHARESDSQHGLHLQRLWRQRGGLLDLCPRIGRRAVDRRCSGRRGQRRASLEATHNRSAGGWLRERSSSLLSRDESTHADTEKVR